MALELDLRWQPVEGLGLEHCQVRQHDRFVEIDGVLIGEREGLAFGLSYHLELTGDWSFRFGQFRLTDGRATYLRSDGEGHWTLAGEKAPHLAGCIDIDISGTPLTNTLPIRRARFEIGMPQRFRMAWLPLDTLDPFVDEQVYTRLDDTHFRYQSGDGTFEQVLTVDEQGFVVDYPTLFRRA